MHKISRIPCAVAMIAGSAAAQTEFKSERLSGLAFRGIGPAIMSGCIADIAIQPGRRGNGRPDWVRTPLHGIVRPRETIE
jgi:hypothetical protein